MEGEATLRAIELFVALVAAAALVAIIVRRIALPYTVALVVLGLIAGAARVTELRITPELVLVVLLPGLVFEAAYRLELDELRRRFGGLVLLAVPGVLVSAGIVALVLNVATGMRLDLAFVVGAMVSATDPAAVIATFKRLRAPGGLATLVEGESLLNDGTGLVVFALALRAVEGEVGLADGVIAFAVTVAVSGGLGLAAGFVTSRLMATVDDHLIELTLTLVMAYGTYLLADALRQSGIIATVVAGVVLGNYGRRVGISEAGREAIDTVWEFLAFLLTALVFLLVGLAIPLGQLVGSLVPILWGVGAVVVGRALVVYLLLGGASRLERRAGVSRPIPSAWLHVLFWSGLRGAVAVAMALALPVGVPNRAVLQAITFGIVLFTLLVQGLTVEPLLERLGVIPPQTTALTATEPTS